MIVLLQNLGNKSVFIDGTFLADGERPLEELAIYPKTLLGGLDAEEAVTDPFGPFNSPIGKVTFETGGDFFLPIFGGAEEEDRGGEGGADFSSDLF